MSRVGKSFITSLLISIIIGFLFDVFFSGGFFFMIGFFVTEISQMIMLYVREANDTDAIAEALVSYVNSPLTDNDYVEVSIETTDNRKLTKMVKVTEFDSVIESLKNQDIKIVSASEYIMRSTVSKESVEKLQKIVDN